MLCAGVRFYIHIGAWPIMCLVLYLLAKRSGYRNSAVQAKYCKFLLRFLGRLNYMMDVWAVENQIFAGT